MKAGGETLLSSLSRAGPQILHPQILRKSRNERDAADLAFLALAQHRLGQSEKARETLGRLRQVMKYQKWAGDPDAQAFLREAGLIELDQVFPADPFAP